MSSVVSKRKFKKSYQKSKKSKRKSIASEDENELEKIVFGRDDHVMGNIKNQKKIKDDDYDGESVKSQSDDIHKELKEKSSVWHDDDDDIDVINGMSGVKKLPPKIEPKQRYKDYLEMKFTNIYRTPKWARKCKNRVKKTDDSAEDGSDDDDDDLTKTAANFVEKSKKINDNFLRYKKCTNLTNECILKSTANCVHFHPTSAVALVSSTNGSVNLFQVNGINNRKIQTVHFKDYQINTARFTINGEQLIVGSHRQSGYFFYYDMIAEKIVKIPFIRGKEKFSMGSFVLSNDGKYIASRGNNGFIHINTARTKEHVFDFKMNGEVSSLTFDHESDILLSHGNEGKVYVWDIRNTKKCVNRFIDEGHGNGTSITVSPNGQFCVTASDMGIVNFYNYKDVISQTEPKPLHSAMNLTTEVSNLKFNHTSELMFMSSPVKDNAIKCIYIPSFTVFPNFPFSGKNYKRIYDIDISVNSGYMSFCTDRGNALLYRLLDYKKY